jgi:Tol biopolymer transport system component
MSPNGAPAGALAFTLTAHGNNFVPASTVQWNGSSRTTTFVSSSQLQAHIMQADLAAPGKVTVTVANPAPGGGTSNAATFTIAADTIAFESARALNGSDATNNNDTVNIWVVNPDGSAASPLSGLIAAFAESNGPAWSSDGSKIAFYSGRALNFSDASNTHGITNIWVMDADGSGVTPLTKLTADAASSFSPAWSPDGRKITFSSERALDGSDAANTSSTSNIWVMNADGSGASALTKLTANGADSFTPTWSPDGSKIVFKSSGALNGSDAANPNGNTNVWVINGDGSGAAIALTKLTKGSSFGTAWSPDGSKIVYSSQGALDGSDALNTNSTFNIWVANADGSGAAAPLTTLTAFGAISIQPAWSPDGGKIAFVSERALDGSNNPNTNATQNIWVMNRDGSQATPLTKLTAAGAGSFDPVWSPDGAKIFFDSLRALDGTDAVNTTSNIWAVNRDGSGATPLTKITSSAANSTHPTQP